MTVAAQRTKNTLVTIADLMGIIRFRFFRHTSNTDGLLYISLGGYAPFELEVNRYPTGAWTSMEHAFDMTGTAYSGALAVEITQLYARPMVGGPVYIADVDVILSKDASVAWMKTKSAAYTLLPTDASRAIYISTGGVTVGTGMDAAPNGSIWTIINNSGANQTITASGVTMYQAGTANTGNRTLAQRGWANVIKLSTSVYSIAGPGVS